MQTRSQLRRRLGISIFVIALSIGTYSRLTGTENIRMIHIVTLITIGLGIGILLVNLFAYIRAGKTNN